MSQAKAKANGYPSVQQMLDELEFSNIEDIGDKSEVDLQIKRLRETIKDLEEKLVSKDKLISSIQMSNETLETTNKLLRKRLQTLDSEPSNKDKSNKSEVIGKDNDPKAPSITARDYDLLKLELNQKTQEIAKLTAQLAQAKSADDSSIVDKNRQQFEKKIHQLTQQNMELAKQKARMQNDIASLKKKYSELEATIEKYQGEKLTDQSMPENLLEKSRFCAERTTHIDIDNMDIEIPSLAPQIVSKALLDQLRLKLEEITEPQRQLCYLNALNTWVEGKLQSICQSIEDLA